MSDKRLARLDTYHAQQALGDLYRQVERLPNGIERVVVRSLNRAILSMRTVTSRMIRAEYAALKQDVDETMWVKQATLHYKVAILYARGRMSIPLVRWKATQTRKGVSVLIRKGGGKKVIPATGGKKNAPLFGTFIAKGDVYGRIKQKSRYPIVRLYGPSFLAILGRPQTRAAQQERATEIFTKRVLVEAKNLLSRVKA